MLDIITKSLKAKLLLLFFVLNFSIILLVGFISYESKREALKEQAEDTLLVMSAGLADKVDRYLSERLDDTRSMALHYSLHALKTTTSSQNRILAQYLKIHPYYDHISIINIEDVRMPAENMNTHAGYSKTWYLPAIKGQVVSSDMYISPLTDKPTLSFAAPVRDEKGRLVSVITANLDMGNLWDLVDMVRRENVKNGLSGYAFIVNKDGFFIAHPDSEKVLMENPINDKDPGLRTVINDMTKGRSGHGSYTYEGLTKVAAYAPCNGYGAYTGNGWSLAITKPYDEIYAPMNKLLRIYLLLFLLTSLLALFISSQLANYLVKPILALKDGATKIGAANFNMRIERQTPDEIGDLAESFNRMAETLKTRDDEIKEYTRSLSRINTELEQKNEDLVKLEKQKAEFMAMITHDIKSPLSTVISYSEMVLDGTIAKDGEEMNTAMTSIHASGHKILSLVENFLVSSAIEAGKLQLFPQPMDINGFIEDELPFYVPQMEKKKINFTFKKTPGLPAVMADKMQLDRAVTNIVSNAIKFTPQNGSITISTYLSGPWVAVTVSDTGRGVPEEELANIFNKYKRSKSTGKVDGQGLGLFISKAVVEAQGGKITVESRPGEGSSFTILLPVKPSQPDGA